MAQKMKEESNPDLKIVLEELYFDLFTTSYKQQHNHYEKNIFISTIDILAVIFVCSITDTACP